MIPFKKISSGDYPLVCRYCTPAIEHVVRAVFADGAVSEAYQQCKIAVVEEQLIFRFEQQGRFLYTMPSGTGNLRYALMQMLEDAQIANMNCQVIGIPEQSRDDVYSAMPQHFQFVEETAENTVDGLFDASCRRLTAVPLMNYGQSVFFNNEGMVPPP